MSSALPPPLLTARVLDLPGLSRGAGMAGYRSMKGAAASAAAPAVRATSPGCAAALAERRPRGAPGPHVPNQIVQTLSRAVHRDIASGALPREMLVALTPVLLAFDDITGACERIRNTPIPFSYSSYVKQFVLLYALIMPFGLVREFGYGTVIASMFTFFATMGLELLATEIEEPFGTDRNDLPLDELADRIARDTRSLLTGGAGEQGPESAA